MVRKTLPKVRKKLENLNMIFNCMQYSAQSRNQHGRTVELASILAMAQHLSSTAIFGNLPM